MKELLYISILAMLLGGCGEAPITPPEPPITYYKVSYTSSSDYEITGLKEQYIENEVVSFSVTVTNIEKELESVKVDETILSSDIGTYTFNMPNHDSTIYVSLIDKEPPTPIKTDISYSISYEMPGKTSYLFKDGEEDLIKNTFVTEVSEDNIISSITSHTYIYGGGYGGSGDTKWVQGDMLKFGTTSVLGELTLSLSTYVNKVTLYGLVSNNSLKLRVGPSTSSDWEGIDLDNKTTLKTLSEMNIANKSNVEDKLFTSVDYEFESTNSIKIGTENKYAFYLTGIKFYFAKELETFTVTWKNYNGDILSVDNDVLEGTVPTYKGELPKKPSTEEYDYIFTGWNPTPSAIKEDTEYTAVFYEKSKSDTGPGYIPAISSDKKTIEYGFYPQSYVSDTSIINELEKLDPINEQGWRSCNGDFYVKATSNVINEESYVFSDNTQIKNHVDYWFKCETIKWNIISSDSNKYVLMSNMLLDHGCFYSSYDMRVIDNNNINPNNYEYSDIRHYLNNSFLDIAFMFGNSNLLDTVIDNLSDKIYLPSKDEVEALEVKTATASDYTRATGSWCNSLYNGSYWTRTPSTTFNYASYNLNSGGFLSEYDVTVSSHSIRPCIRVSL